MEEKGRVGEWKGSREGAGYWGEGVKFRGDFLGDFRG